MRYYDLETWLKALRCLVFGRADHARWTDPGRYEDWEPRTRQIAAMIPAGSRVLELGAGARDLERCLDPLCVYTPADLVSRGEDTLVFDLNARPLPDLRAHRFDVVVMSGVLEYVRDLGSFLAWLTRQADACACSYCLAERSDRWLRLLEALRRLGAGWVSTMNEREFIERFARHGFELQVRLDPLPDGGAERLYVFRRRPR